MTINDLVDRIYKLNIIKDGFWKDYLEEIRIDFRVSWHRSSGFDLRPLSYVNSYADTKKKSFSEIKRIGKELKKTDFIFSDSLEYQSEAYEMLLDLSNSRQHQNFNDYNLLKINKRLDYYRGNGTFDCKAFKLLSKEEKDCYKQLLFKNSYGHENHPIVPEDREHDGFALRVYGYDFSLSYITIIFLCLDDRIVKKIFEDYNINVFFLFENRVGRKGGGLPMNYIFNEFEKSVVLENIKYIFTDNCYFDDDSEKIKYHYDYISKDFDYIKSKIRDEYFKDTDWTPRGKGFWLFKNTNANI